jgi:hypothetical protein
VGTMVVGMSLAPPRDHRLREPCAIAAVSVSSTNSAGENSPRPRHAPRGDRCRVPDHRVGPPHSVLPTVGQLRLLVAVDDLLDVVLGEACSRRRTGGCGTPGTR